MRCGVVGLQEASSRFLPSSSELPAAHHAVETASIVLANGAAATATSPALLPAAGSSLIMLTIVALLYTWEGSVEWVRETVPASLLPVVESVLAEVGGLGFIGLVLQTVLQGTNKEFLENVSVRVFGEGEILVETFEYLHSAFFQVGVAFFVAAGAMVAVGLQKLAEIDDIEELQVDAETGACTVTAEKLTRYVPITEQEDLDQPVSLSSPLALIDEIFMSTEERAGLALLLRSQLMERFDDLPDTFRVEKYIRNAFSENLLEIVELSPLTWIYLIPALALANSIDLSHEVVNAASPNAAESAGFFFSTPWAIVPSTVSVVLSLVWGIWNCWKMTLIKYMTIPRLSRDGYSSDADNTNTDKATIQIQPPPIESSSARQAFASQSSSPFWVSPIEAVWGEPARTPFQELFGTAGASGLELYQNSIKYQAWLCITQIVFFGTQIVSRDIDAILTGATVGDPEHLVPELVTHGIFVLLSLMQLIFITPRAFWNHCLVSCLGEDEEVKKLLAKST